MRKPLKLLRILASASLLVGALFFIWGTMDDWRENPVETVIDSTNYPVENVAFPAVTVCQGTANRAADFGFVETFFNFVRCQMLYRTSLNYTYFNQCCQMV